jgi:hypothetical protein
VPRRKRDDQLAMNGRQGCVYRKPTYTRT